MLKEINQKPEEVIFIDDKETDIEKAKRLGINAILFKNTKRLISDLKILGISV